jgi:hypothetical protein
MGSVPNPDWEFQKYDAHGFGIYLEKKIKEEQDEQKKKEWKEQQEAERKARNARDKEQFSQSLSSTDRDQNFRALLKQLTLAPHHKKQLLERGLSESEINLGMFRTVCQYQTLDKPVSPKLPGVGKNGDRWVNAGGLLVPVWQGLNIVGAQVRLDYRTEDKYRWLKSGDNSSHLNNNEIPIAIINPPNANSDTIGFCESTGFKPFIAARRLGHKFIGASGRNFRSAKKQIYKVIKDHPKDKPLILYPDANCLNDPHTFRQYQGLHSFLTDWGYKLNVAYWGHFFNKKIGDIDEWIINNKAEDIEYIDWEAFAFQWKVSKAEYYRLKKFKPTETVNQRYLTPILPKNEEREIIAVKSPMNTGKTEIVRVIKETLTKHGGIILGSRNSLLIQTGERIGVYHLHQDDAFFLTKYAHSWIANCADSLHRWDDEDFDDRILILDEWSSTIKHILIGNTIRMRRSLITAKFEQAVKRARYIFLLDGNLKDSDVDYIRKLSGIEKVRKIFNEYSPSSREVNFCLGSYNRGDENPHDHASFTEWIFKQTRPTGIISDSQKECEAIHRKLLDKGINDSEIIRIDSKTVTEDYAKEFLRNPAKYIKARQIKYVILSPSAESGVDINMAKVLPGSIKQKPLNFKQPFDNLLQPESKDEAISLHLPEINLSNYFEEIFFIRFHIDTETAMQMLNRFRDPGARWNIWSKPYLSNEGERFASPFERRVVEQINQFVKDDLELLGSNEAVAKLKEIVASSTDRIHMEAIGKINALLNYDRANLRENLLAELEAQGHTIKCGWISKETSDIKDYKRVILSETAHKIFKSENIDMEAAERINNSWAATWDDKCKAEKSLLINKILPGISESEIWSPELIEKIKDDRLMLNRLGLRWLWENSQRAKEIQVEKWERLLNAENPSFFPSDWRSPILIIENLQKVGLASILNSPDRLWEATDEEILSLCRRAGHYHRRWLFGKKGALSAIQFLNRRVLNQLGYKLARKRRRRGGEVVSVYILEDLYSSLEIGEEKLALSANLKEAIANRYNRPEEKKTSDPASSLIDTKLEETGSPSDSVTPALKNGSLVFFNNEECRVISIGDGGLTMRGKMTSTLWHALIKCVQLIS